MPLLVTRESPSGAILADIASNPVPQGARAGYFTTSDKVRLRYAVFPRTGPEHKGTVCLVQGRTEFIEKYYETIADFRARGFAVATYDLRGQGGSDRLTDTRRLGHVERFSDYWLDLKSFHAQILLPDCPPPFYLVGHSTGGLISLLAATRDRLMFDRVFVSSPMLGLPGLPFGQNGTRAVLEVARFLGLGRLPLQAGAGKTATLENFEGNPLTSDATRFGRAMDTLAARPELGIGAPSVAWVSSALEGMTEAGSDSFPRRLLVPVFMVAAALDRVVVTQATERLGVRLRNGHFAVIPGARHEMLMEADPIRAQVFAAFDAFVTERSE